MDKLIAKTAPDDRWLTPMEVLRMLGSQAKSPFAMLDKISRHYDPIFTRPTNGKWRESNIQKYLAARAGETKP